MGNSLGGKKTTKIMKINGETIKLKTPVKAGEVVKDYPGYVLLESESVKHYGIRSKPLELHQALEPKRLYFLVELPKFPVENVPRRVRSGINMSAKDRLESLKLSRRSVSDLSILKPTSMMIDHSRDHRGGSEIEAGGTNRVTMRLPKAVVAKLMEESNDEAEVAQKIMDLCMGKTANIGGGGGSSSGEAKGKEHQQVHCRGGNNGKGGEGYKAREVCFL